MITAAIAITIKLTNKAIRAFGDRFSTTVISVGSGFAFGSGSIFVSLIKATAFTRL